MSGKRLIVVATSIVGLLITGLPAASQGKSHAKADYPVQITQPGGFPPLVHRKGPPKEVPLHRPHFKAGSSVADPVEQTSTPTPAAAQTGGQWEGLGSSYPGFTLTAVPPDPNLAVGPNHIVQWVNNALVIFDKQGNQLQSPVSDESFWGDFSTCFQGGGYSDPIVEYDKAADRWIVGEVALPIPGFFGQYAQCFAVSKTSDPTWTSDANGNNTSYNIWAYGFGTTVPDYDKIGVWSDAYDVTWNIFLNGVTFNGAEACAWDRAAMLAGAAMPAFQCFQLTSNYASLLPADLDGATPPPAGSPDYFMDIDPSSGALNLWKLQVDTSNFANSTFTGPTSIAGVAPFTAPCLAQASPQDCLPQPGTTQLVDALGDRLMFRVAYRNFDTHESLVANHTVLTAGGNTGVRWYEVRDPNGTPTIFQQGTFAPDSDNRWMASVAMDQSGDIGVGYSVSSSATFPSIRYTGWEPGDVAGSLEAETSLIAGSGSQSGANRWGDYSAMKPDPSDDCTFWYTQEYYISAQDQTLNWNTRIGSFKFPACGQALIATSTALTTSGSPSTYSQSVTFTATVTSGSGTPAGSVTFKDGGTILGSPALNASGVAALTTAALAAGVHSTITAAYGGDSTYGGSTSSPLSQTVNKDNSNTSLSVNPSSSTYGQSVQLTATVTPVAPATTTPTGTVTFFDGPTSLGSAGLNGSGTASISTSSLAVGGHSITASYGGDGNYNSSGSSAQPETVSKANSNTTVIGAPNPSTYGTSVKFTATVTPVSPATTTPTGTVTFFDSSTNLGSAPLSGGTASISVSTLSATIHSITASYGGNADYNTSTSSPLAETVNKANSTTTLTSSPNPSTSGQSVTLTATLSPSTGTGSIQFFDGGTSLGTQPVSGGKATLNVSTLSVGGHNLTATYSGDGNYSGSTSNAVSQTVNSAGTPDFSIAASPGTLTLSRGSSGGYTVTVTALNGFAKSVSFSVSGVPSHATTSFSPSSVSGSGTSTLTVHTSSKTSRNTYTLTIKGTGSGGTPVHTTTVKLTVQ